MWVGIGFGIFLLLIIVLLASPVDFVFYLEHRAAWRFRAEVRWLYGSLHFLLPRSRKAARKPPPDKRPERRKARRRLSIGQIKDIITTPGLLSELRRLLSGLFHAIRVHRLSAEWKAGLGDPFQTGMLWSFLGPFSAFASSFGWPLVMVPEFDADKPVFTGWARGTLSVYPFKIIGTALRLACSRPAFRIYRILARSGGER